LNPFCPYVEKFKGRHLGWIGKMLLLSGRTILVKASLRSMASHLLSALQVHVGIIHDFDKSAMLSFGW
jgi:hypothetical protein